MEKFVEEGLLPLFFRLAALMFQPEIARIFQAGI